MDALLQLLRQRPRAGWSWTLTPQQRGWTRGTALAMANVALLTYSDDGFIDQSLLARGFTDVHHLRSAHAADTQAFLAARPDAVVVAFRGTEPTQGRDFWTDFDAAQKPFDAKFGIGGWGNVHEGWAVGVGVVLPELAAMLNDARFAGRAVWFTGHSLGGALAMVAAAIVSNAADHPIAGVFTFGQPRVGDDAFRARYEQHLGGVTFRCVNDHDLVPHVPPRELLRREAVVLDPEFLAQPSLRQLAGALSPNATPERYAHAGQLRLLVPTGGVSDRPADELAKEPAFLAGRRDAREVFFELPPFALASPLLIKDHAPLNDVTHDGYIDRIERLV